MNRASGLTLIELLVVLAVAAIVLGTTAAYSVPWLAREGLRSAVYDVQTITQLARIEAVNRNRRCRLLVDTSARTFEVWDLVDVGDTSDDVLLHHTELPSRVTFARPDLGSVVTLPAAGTDKFEAVFESDGTLASANGGAIALFGGEQYGRLSVYVAGAVEAERWTGSAWKAGL